MSWRTWRPTVAIIQALELFTEDELKLMFCNVNVKVSAEQAVMMANYIDALLESDHQPIEDALGEELSSDSSHLSWYKEWLQEFTRFCRESGGFMVG